MTTRDAAAQPERTRLSWRRTVLAASVVVLLAARHALTGHVTPGDLVFTALLGFSWLGLLIGAQARIRTLARARPGPPRAPWPALAAAVVVAIAALGLLIL